MIPSIHDRVDDSIAELINTEHLPSTHFTTDLHRASTEQGESPTSRQNVNPSRQSGRRTSTDRKRNRVHCEASHRRILRCSRDDRAIVGQRQRVPADTFLTCKGSDVSRSTAFREQAPVSWPNAIADRSSLEISKHSTRTMYSDADNTFDANEEFFNALALLHSAEEDSAEKLRRMLDASIERKFGPDRTLVARMSQHSLPSRRTRRESSVRRRTKGEGADRWRFDEESGTFSIAEIVPLIESDAIVDTTGAGKEIREMCEIDTEDLTDRGDIPRISIPDEGSGDGALCKVCNGAKLGPLILLECQECQDVYHPLCHHPPVVDIDVYDPRLVWRCRKCIDVSSAAGSSVREEKKTQDKFGPIDNGAENGTDRTIVMEKERKKNSYYFRKNSIHFDGRKAKDPIRSGGRSSHGIVRPTKMSSRNLKAPQSLTSSQKCATSSIAQSRKRIGSKLSISRVSTK